MVCDDFISAECNNPSVAALRGAGEGVVCVDEGGAERAACWRSGVMQAELYITEGRLKGQRFVLEDGASVTLGRSLRADIQVPDQGISRLHCRIDNLAGDLTITDLDSSNGTQVNGSMIQSKTLTDKDVIALGASVIEVHMAGAGNRSGRAPSETSLQLVQDKQPKATAVKRKYDRQTATIALDTASGNPDLVRARKRLAAVCSMANTIYTKTSLQEILDTAVGTILEITGADRSAIVMYNDATKQLTPVAIRAKGDSECTSDEFPVSRTIIEETLRQGVSVISSDAAEDDRFKLGASVVVQNIHSVMCAPLMTEDRIIGAIYVDSSSAGSLFTENELALLAAVGQQAGVAIERGRLVNDLENLFVGSMHTLIAAIEAKDTYTRGHSERVTHFALLIARGLELDENARAVIELAGVLHDVGKIAVPEAVLQKPGKLSEAEFGEIRKHPDAGAGIIRNMPEINRIVNMPKIVKAVRHHHERWDGTGYPAGLTGETIPLSSRILSVADTYDAITSDRPYRKGQPADIAAGIIRDCAGTQFDPDVAEVFSDIHEQGMFASGGDAITTGRFRIGRGRASQESKTAATVAAKGNDL